MSHHLRRTPLLLSSRTLTWMCSWTTSPRTRFTTQPTLGFKTSLPRLQLSTFSFLFIHSISHDSSTLSCLCALWRFRLEQVVTHHKATTNSHKGVDLLLADVSKSLPILVISSSSSNVLAWNQWGEQYLEDVFSFTKFNLHDDCIPVLIHLDDPDLMKAIYDWAYTFHFNIAKDCWSLNELHLTLPTDPTQLVNVFSIPLPLFPFACTYLLH